MTESLGAIETAAEFVARKSAAWALQRDVTTKDIGRRGAKVWVREAWTFMPQHNYSEKVFLVERLRLHAHQGEQAFSGGAIVGDIEYRFGYYIVGRVGRAAGRWVWGQFSPIIPHADVQRLLDKARQERTLLTD